MNRYPLWKNILVVGMVLMGLVYSLPNIFSQDPAVEITATRHAEMNQAVVEKVEKALAEAKVEVKRAELANGKILVRFPNNEAQLHATAVLEKALGNDFNHAMTISPDVPGWLSFLGAKPMYLGLDLRGGVHVLIDVDMDAAVKQTLERYTGDARTLLRNEKLRYTKVAQIENGVELVFPDAATRDKALDLAKRDFGDLTLEAVDQPDSFLVRGKMSEVKQRETRRFALQQNITTLRNRINALGVAEPIIQQQGERRIVVQLPGVSDPAKLKELLGATATLEYRLQDTEHSLEDALAGKVPPNSKLYKTREGRPLLLQKRVIVTGNQITDASSGIDSRSGSPMVSVRLDSQGARRMREMTNENVGKPMAVVFIETRVENVEVDGKMVKRKTPVEEVISVANILEPFGASFQTTGLDSTEEAHDLALLLRAGALAAPMDIVEERTVGPSLGAENITKGFHSNLYGYLAIVIFMVVYYNLFGVFSVVALGVNLLLLVAVLSLFQATLTLPGMAGIALTLGMAIDANVLINERIREELRTGLMPQSAIAAGYERAFATILDSNITTFIAGFSLFWLGSGPIRGFAVVLCLGILTSIFSAVLVSRLLVNQVYGRRARLAKISI